MKWIGLTGGIATGKSTVAAVLRRLGIPVVDADEMAREVVAPGSPGLSEVKKRFGAEVITAEGALDRSRLGQLIFSDPKARADLEGILHPMIRQRVKILRQELAEQGHRLAFYDVPLLFEKNMEKQFDGIVVVSCSPEEQKSRLMKRSGLTAEEAELRISQQWPLKSKIAGATWVIDNSTGSDVEAQVRDLLKKLGGL